MSKQLWFDEFEQRFNDKLNRGVPESRAYDEAAAEAGPVLRERLADMADCERKRMKGE